MLLLSTLVEKFSVYCMRDFNPWKLQNGLPHCLCEESWPYVCGLPILAVHCRAVHCSSMPCSAVRFNADIWVQWSSVQCSAMQCSEVNCSAVKCSVVQCSAVQCSVVQCSTVWRWGKAPRVMASDPLISRILANTTRGFTVDCVHCTYYSIQFVVYNIHCLHLTVYSVQCTV